MKCPKCKKPLREGAKFCPACGARVKKHKGHRIAAVVLVILLLVGAVAGGLAIGFFAEKHFSSSKSAPKISNVEDAIAHAKKLGEEYGYENAMSEMTEKVTTEIDGDCYYRLQQNYQGIPVYGRNVIYVASEAGTVVSVTGNPSDIEIEGNLSPSITREQALDSIMAYQEEALGFDDSFKTEIEALSEYDLNIYSSDDVSCLVYRICVNGYEFLVDAHSAEVCYANCLIRFATVEGNLQGQTQIYKDLHYTETNNVFSLEDSSKCISVYTANNQFQFWKLWNPQWVQVGKDLVTWSHGESADPSSVDAFANVQIAYDYFNSVLNNKSTDGKGEKQIRVITGVLDLHDNACFSPGDETINFGKAKDFRFDKSAYIDWVAHEYMHGIEYNHSNMNYSGESGAIMEGLSDIFAELAESWSESKIKNKNVLPNWIFTEDRSIISPGDSGFPATYRGRNWKDTNNTSEDNDFGGVHRNSTVISHAAYLMWNGIDGNERKRISTEDLAKLWYRAMLMMPSDCDFIECRTLVELAASTMNLTDLQKQCVCEAFDTVGILRASEEERSQLVHFVANGKTSIKGTIYEVKTLNGIETVVPVPKATITVYSDNSSKAYKKLNMKDENGFFEIEAHAGTYSVVITAEGYIGQTISFELFDNEVRYFSVELKPSNNSLGNYSDAYNAYLNAARKTTESDSWSEHLDLTANMALTNGSAKTKTKMLMTSDAAISNYSESDPSRVRMSGAAEMSVMGQTYAWNIRYEDGIAHYQYTQPNQTSADMAIDPSFFNFGTMTSDMMTKAKMSGNQITFTVPGDKITEVGIAAVNQMSGVDDLKYGDVAVAVTISDDGMIDTITMTFHASLKYQGYDADVDYDIAYHFSQSTTVSNAPSVSIVPCSYTNQDYKYDILAVHEVNGNQIVFTVWWYRIWDISHVTATLDGNIASFDYTDANSPNIRAKGTIEFIGDNAILTVSECSNPNIHQEPYHFNFLAEALTEQQLREAGHFLGVPDGLDVTYKQGTPYYWEGVGIYCTEVGIYYNGELVAGADVNSLTGAVAGGIYMYSGSSSTENTNIATTFGYTKAWEFHDRSGAEHLVTDLAFQEDGTFCCCVGIYLSEWIAAFTGTYEVTGNELILQYTFNGEEKITSYQINWDDRILKQTSDENLVIPHQAGSEYHFEESSDFTTGELFHQFDLFQRYLQDGWDE